MAHNYPDSDVKILFAQAGGRCAFPGCRRQLVLDATEHDPKRVIGKIAHIVADSDTGPRGDPSMPKAERRREPNLILLCGTHHDTVDVQPNTVTVEDLHTWKHEHLAWVAARLADAVVAVGFAELERITAVLLAHPAPPVGAVAPPTPPPEKLSKNQLTVAVSSRVQIGSLRFFDIEEFVARTTQSDGHFGERLKAGFRDRYDILVAAEASGDQLFEELVAWAAGGSTEFDSLAAALSVVTYLFTICDLFEP